MRPILFLLAVLVGIESAEAQLFKRFGRAQVSPSVSNCPGGVCPIQGTSVATVAASGSRSPGHWSYPGTITNHLESEHGVATAGMSRQQMLDLHDSLHEGTAPSVRAAAKVMVRGTYGRVSSQEAKGFGSTGSNAVGFGSVGSRQSFGSVGSSARLPGVGERDADGQVIVGIIGFSAPSQSSTLGFKARKQSRQVILESLDQAVAAGTVGEEQAKEIRRFVRTPRQLAIVEDLILDKAQTSGAYVFQLDRNGDVVKSAIDWEAIGDFIIKIAPIIFKLIELFLAFENAGNADALVMFEQMDFQAAGV